MAQKKTLIKKETNLNLFINVKKIKDWNLNYTIRTSIDGKVSFCDNVQKIKIGI